MKASAGVLTVLMTAWTSGKGTPNWALTRAEKLPMSALASTLRLLRKVSSPPPAITGLLMRRIIIMVANNCNVFFIEILSLKKNDVVDYIGLSYSDVKQLKQQRRKLRKNSQSS
jgi:hypothetical protein